MFTYNQHELNGVKRLIMDLETVRNIFIRRGIHIPSLEEILVRLYKRKKQLDYTI